VCSSEGSIYTPIKWACLAMSLRPGPGLKAPSRGTVLHGFRRTQPQNPTRRFLRKRVGTARIPPRRRPNRHKERRRSCRSRPRWPEPAQRGRDPSWLSGQVSKFVGGRDDAAGSPTPSLARRLWRSGGFIEPLEEVVQDGGNGLPLERFRCTADLRMTCRIGVARPARACAVLHVSAGAAPSLECDPRGRRLSLVEPGRHCRGHPRWG